jgi:hypothetical protein
MLDVLKSLFENNVISEDIRTQIEEAWEARVAENREQVTQQLREEFAQKYEHDRNVMIEAIDRMVADQLAPEIVEFAEDRKQLAEAKAKYALKMKHDSAVFKEFITRTLAQEVKELHEDQKSMANKFFKLEEFVVEALANEIAEFYADKKDLANTKVKLIKEGRQQLGKMKKEFVKRAAVMVEQVVVKSLNNELVQLKEDIEAARRADFGRKIFEAFSNEYQNSYLNEKSETSKLLKVINKKDSAITMANTVAVKAQRVIESKEMEIRRLKEAAKRKEVMSELLAPLNAEQKGIMSELLESVQTTRLTESFNKYLPTIIEGSTGTTKKRQALVEAKEITGNKVTTTKTNSSEPDSNIVDIRRLAGLN